jgi:hypothetical protein
MSYGFYKVVDPRSTLGEGLTLSILLFIFVMCAQLRWIVVLTFFSFLSLADESFDKDAQAINVPPPYRIEILATCPPKPDIDADVITLMFDETTSVSSWNHASSVKGLRLHKTAYTVSQNALGDCRGWPFYEAVFAKKYMDWNQQHINGLELLFPAKQLHFQQLYGLSIELKIKSNRSYIPSAKKLRRKLDGLLSSQQITELDDSKISFSLGLFAQGFDDQSTETLNGLVNVTLEPSIHFDKWLRITVPATNMAYFTERNWNETPVDLAQLGLTQIYGFRLNPETSSGKVARNYLGKAFEKNAPDEIFKEMDISIRDISLLLKPKTTKTTKH